MQFSPTNVGAAIVVATLAAVVGCQGGPPTIFGYQLGNQALYDTSFQTIYVPAFSNRAFQTQPYRGIETDITRAIVRELTTKTPYTIVSDPNRADTEIRGVVIALTKNILNRNQQNLIREEEVVLTVDVLWRDLRTGKNLSAPLQRRFVNGSLQTGPLPDAQPIPFDPSVPLPPAIPAQQTWMPIRLMASSGHVLPELGESITTGEQKAVNNLAVLIVSMMEKGWGNKRVPE